MIQCYKAYAVPKVLLNKPRISLSKVVHILQQQGTNVIYVAIETWKLCLTKNW
jgi:hypothetical protein